MQTHNLRTPPYFSKALFCWLALLLGCIGAHWWLVGKRRAWCYLLCPPLAAFLGWADCMRYGLMPDAQFDARINPSESQSNSPKTQTTAAVIVAVVLSLAAFATALMASLAMLFQWWFAGNLA